MHTRGNTGEEEGEVEGTEDEDGAVREVRRDAAAEEGAVAAWMRMRKPMSTVYTCGDDVALPSLVLSLSLCACGIAVCVCCSGWSAVAL